MRAAWSSALCFSVATGCGYQARDSLGDDGLGDPSDAGTEADAGARDAGEGPLPDGGCTPVVEPKGAWSADSVSSGGEMPALAIDPAGDLHVSYYDISEYSVRYATNAGGAWRTEQVEGDAVTSESAIAVGASGTVHVVYGSSVDVGLHHAWNDGGGWEIDAIPGGESGMIPSLALDAEGGLHVTFLYATGDGTAALRYVTNAGGDWRMDVLESGSSAGQYSAVTVDGAGAAHVAYYWPVAGWFELFHATNASGAWVSEDVDGPISEWAGSRLPAITVDESGAVELAYPASDGDVELSAEIRYATNASGGWRIETVDPDADTASWWVWMTPHRGHVHVSYDFQMYGPAGVDLESLAFRHATNASGCWRIDEIEVGGASGALAIDPGEQLHAVYVIWPMGTTELQHAVRDVSAD